MLTMNNSCLINPKWLDQMLSKTYKLSLIVRDQQWVISKTIRACTTKRETAKLSVIIVLGFEQLFYDFHRPLHDSAMSRSSHCVRSGMGSGNE